MKILRAIIPALLIALAATSCGDRGDRQVADAVEESNTQLFAALQDHDIPRIEMLADSMANYVDDLTPEETITVLMAYLEVHNDAARKGEKERDLITIRKFVDVYDIAAGNNPKDFRAVVSKARDINNTVDLMTIVADFRDKLANYDALQGGEEGFETAANPKRDTITTSSESKPEVKPEEVEVPASQMPTD